MLLGTLMENLALGELSQHTLGKSGVILEKDRPTVIMQLNIALKKLHTLYMLQEKSLVLRNYPELTTYVLDSKYALSNTGSTEVIKYIEDESNPFLDDILNIECVVDNELGLPIKWDDASIPEAWKLTSYNTFEIPCPEEDLLYTIWFKANHAVIPTDADDNTIINLPPCLDEALQAYIASRCFVSLGSQSSAGLSSYYFSRYKMLLKEVDDNNMLNLSKVSTNLKLQSKGFI